jgi:UDP-glucose 4-epimerase
MHVVVTGGAGFIGSNLVDRLLDAGHRVVVIDNFSTGSRAFLRDALASNQFQLLELNLARDHEDLTQALVGADFVFHLSANADVRYGWVNPRQDLEQNVIVTDNLLNAMHRSGVSALCFASTASVYGDQRLIPIPEDAPFPVQTSLYGASKLAAEGLIEAYVEAGKLSATIFRLVSIVGPRYTHGHVVDFVRQLRADPSQLRILGDGTQRKSYLHVDDCVRAMTDVLGSDDLLAIYNLGNDDYSTVSDSVEWICRRLEVTPTLEFSGGDRGWVGDNPFIYLDTQRIRKTGWEPRCSIQASIEATVDYLIGEPWVLDRPEGR